MNNNNQNPFSTPGASSNSGDLDTSIFRGKSEERSSSSKKNDQFEDVVLKPHSSKRQMKGSDHHEDDADADADQISSTRDVEVTMEDNPRGPLDESESNQTQKKENKSRRKCKCCSMYQFLKALKIIMGLFTLVCAGLLAACNIAMLAMYKSNMDWATIGMRGMLVPFGVIIACNEILSPLPFLWAKLFFTLTFYFPRGFLYIFIGLASFSGRGSGAESPPPKNYEMLRYTSGIAMLAAGGFYLVMGLLCVDALDSIVTARKKRKDREESAMRTYLRARFGTDV
eukprot:GEZU01002290.1.p1 GENE.GEZU01002290.1~~GEZU01002290.1.p1  ORF type:complete len:284 (-),score=75.83 GEZU01002290.1:56-907(-)